MPILVRLQRGPRHFHPILGLGFRISIKNGTIYHMCLN